MVKKRITSKALDELSKDLVKTLAEKVFDNELPMVFQEEGIKSLLTEEFFEIDNKNESESISYFRINRIAKKIFEWIDEETVTLSHFREEYLTYQKAFEALLYITGSLRRHVEVVDEFDLYDREDAKERIDLIPKMP